MTRPLRAFVSYLFRDGPIPERVVGMLGMQGITVLDRSIPADSPLPVSGEDLTRRLRYRISNCDVVIVYASRGLESSTHVRNEVLIARELGKPIVAVRPNGQYAEPIPRVVHESAAAIVGHRSQSIARACLGDAPAERVVFDISEDANRRSVAQWAALAVGGASVLLAWRSATDLVEVRRELREAGICVEPAPWFGSMAAGFLAGAAVGWCVDYMTGGRAAAELVLTFGGAGAAVAAAGKARAELRSLGHLVVLTRLAERR